MKKIFFYAWLLVPVACTNSNADNNVKSPSTMPASAMTREFVSASVNGAAFDSQNEETGLYNPLTKMLTVTGEQKNGVSISLSFPPKLGVNENCTGCYAAFFIKKDGHTKTYSGKNISNLHIKLTTKKGTHAEGEFSFTAGKASNDQMTVSNGKFSSEITGY
jgi:hypothetical protein